jgi:type I restriction-modification system DNA methylase subunit
MTYAKATDHLERESQQESGSFYTPKELALKAASKLSLQRDSIILDPCVGRANLFRAVKELHPEIPNENFYGIDIDKTAIEFNLNDPELKGMHFQVGNCLEDDTEDDLFWEKPYDMEYKTYKNKTLGFKWQGETKDPGIPFPSHE